MKKVTPILDRTIFCPKCQKKTMRRALPQKVGCEWFCDQCHIYFGTEELVLKWDYDYGDFNDVSFETIWNINAPRPCKHDCIAKYPPFVPEIFVQYHTCLDCGEKLSLAPLPFSVEDKLISTNWFEFDSMSTFQIDEPRWKNNAQKQEAYEIVTRMFLGIPEYAEHEDGCGNRGIDIGLIGYPI